MRVVSASLCLVTELFVSFRSRQRWVQQNKLNIISYITAFAFVLFVYHVFSDGDFSFLLTLGSMVRMFGFVLLLIKFGIQRNCSGISLKTLELYALVFAARLSSILVYEGMCGIYP